MAFKDEDIKHLETVMAKGLERVRYQDKEVTYQTVSELKKAWELMQRQLKKAPLIRRVVSTFSKRLDQ